MSDLVVLDGDTLAYICAAMNEERGISVEHIPSGNTRTFNNRTEFKKHLEKQNKEFPLTDFIITDTQETNPLGYAIHGMKKIIESVCAACDTNNFHIVVSGKDNFRLDIPLPTRYKSNREGTIRPLQLSACKDYLIKHQCAEISEGVEADDVLSWYVHDGVKTGKKIVQAGQDKDGYACQGWFYNWITKEEPFEVRGLGDVFMKGPYVKWKGRKGFYVQFLAGDSSDGYKPTDLCGKRFGLKGAYNLLLPLKTDKECWEAVVSKYKEWYPEPVVYQAWNTVPVQKDWMEILQMYVDCAWMQRFEGDRVIVKNAIDKLGIQY